MMAEVWPGEDESLDSYSSGETYQFAEDSEEDDGEDDDETDARKQLRGYCDKFLKPMDIEGETHIDRSRVQGYICLHYMPTIAYLLAIGLGKAKAEVTDGQQSTCMPFECTVNGMDGKFNYTELERRLRLIRKTLDGVQYHGMKAL
jgi:hypothetical protein